MDKKEKQSEQNSFEGGYAGFWDDDINSELDTKWANSVRKVLAEKKEEEEKKAKKKEGKKSAKDIIKGE